MARVTTNLLKYQKSLKQAKAATRLHFQSASIKKLVRDYEEYQKQYYKTSKSLRQAGVKLYKGHKQGLFVSGHVEEYSARADIMSITQFKRYQSRYGDLTPSQIAEKQYNLIDMDTSMKLQQALRENGLGEYSLDIIRARQLPDEVWLKMEEIAEKEDTTISDYFFGSD